jgi:hypothetical protein
MFLVSASLFSTTFVPLVLELESLSHIPSCLSGVVVSNFLRDPWPDA